MRFDDFVVEHGPALLRFAYLLTRDGALAEDLVQESLIRAHRRWQTAEHPEAYVRRIVLNEYLSWRRRRSSSEVTGAVLADPLQPDLADQHAERDLVWRALGELPRRQRAVLVLRYYEARPDDEIAVLLGCAVGTVRSLAVRAFATLRHSRRHLVMGVAAATVVAIAVLAVVLRDGAGSNDVVPIVGGGVVGGATQPISFRGVEIQVPASWKLNDQRCGTPMSDTVIFGDGLIQLCRIEPQPSSLTVVRLFGNIRQEVATAATEEIVLDGHPARRGTGVLVIPGLDVMISVESPDQRRAAGILDTARVVAIDSAGCATRVDRLTPDPGTSEQPMIPGRPAAAAVCRYVANAISRSEAVPAGRLDELVGILNALPVGIGQPGEGYAVAAELCAEDVRRGFIVQFSYPDRPVLKVFVHISGCDGLYASAGEPPRKINEPLVTFLTELAGYDTGYPDPRAIR